MRLVLLVVLTLSGCAGRGSFRPPELPELVAVVRPTAPLTAGELLLVPGERMIWDVQAKGFSIARAELMVGDQQVTSRVETGVLASTITSLRHELATTIDVENARTATAHETLVLEGKTTVIDAVFDAKSYMIDGKPVVSVPGVHTIHSALGLLRAWVSQDAKAGVLPILVAGQLYRLEVAQPNLTELSGTSMFRVDCRIAGLGSVSIWFAITDDHVPARIEITTTEGKLTAELIERTR
ncbi:MAG: DUF3108 domain-containing protein [Deltaproteobacteria bacterium]|nr:DUF3108 domain-containing protein [Deltaproteobacteria bacterium]